MGISAPAQGLQQIFLQSYDDKILILPALPDEITNGRVKGLRAKGGIVTDIVFKDGRLERMKVYTEAEESIRITFIYRGKSIEMDIVKGQHYIIDETMFED